LTRVALTQVPVGFLAVLSFVLKSFGIHLGRQGVERSGFKCYEYASAVDPKDAFEEGTTIAEYSWWVEEALTLETAKHIKSFCELLKDCARTEKPLSKEVITTIAPWLKVNRSNDYQKYHVKVGRDRTKTIIDEHIATNDNSPVLSALQNTMETLTRQFYRRNRARIAHDYERATRSKRPKSGQCNET
jgi:hypothetical protein